MENIAIAPGVTLHILEDEKFRRTRISVNFITPSRRETATAHALLPMVMERGYADCPDMTELSIRLAALYGAEMSLDNLLSGGNRVFSAGITGIRDKYALHGEGLSEAYADLLMGVVLRPAVENGAFSDVETNIEKQALEELIAAEINDKRTYCIRQAQRRLFAGTPFEIERRGYAEELPGIDGRRLYEVYREMIDTARVEVFAIGCEAAPLKKVLERAFGGRRACAFDLFPPSALPEKPFVRVEEPVDAIQGKLCMLFTLPAPLQGRDRSVMRLAMSVLGSSPTSRLFMNVREKQSLCYYCSAGYMPQSASVRIDSGVEHANAGRTEAAVLKEIELLATEGPTETEMDNAKRSVDNVLRSVRDSLAATEGWYFSETVFFDGQNPEDAIAENAGVTGKEVRDMIGRLRYSLVYTLTDAGEGEEQ